MEVQSVPKVTTRQPSRVRATKHVRVELSPEEHRAVVVAAALAGQSIQAFATSAVAAAARSLLARRGVGP